MNIVTRGFGPLQMLCTRGYGRIGKALREVLKLFSEVTKVLRMASNVRSR